jgi:tetrapyrrole methylase family protein/MazG family protein
VYYRQFLSDRHLYATIRSLLPVADILLGPQGCPWDQKQTFAALQPCVLVEAHEVMEAVDSGDEAKIVEEWGDLLYTIIHSLSPFFFFPNSSSELFSRNKKMF